MMLKVKIQYYGNTLCVYLSGVANYGDIELVKEKIKLIMREYGVMKLQLDLDSAYNVDIGMFDEFKNNFISYNRIFNDDNRYFEQWGA